MKKIKFYDVKEFVKKAMLKDFPIKEIYNDNLQVTNPETNECFDITASSLTEDGRFKMFISFNQSNYEEVLCNEESEPLWELLMIEVRKYISNNTLNHFYNFFKESSNKTINNLEDDEEY